MPVLCRAINLYDENQTDKDQGQLSQSVTECFAKPLSLAQGM